MDTSINDPEQCERWLRRMLDRQIKAASLDGLELHIDLPVADELHAFARHPSFFQKVRAAADPALRSLSDLRYRHRRADEHGSEVERELLDRSSRILEEIRSLQDCPGGALRLDESVNRIRELAEDVRAAEDDPQLTDIRARLSALRASLLRLVDLLHRWHEIASARICLLTGQAGVGKTHLLRMLTRMRYETRRPAILLLGRDFRRGDDAPWLQAVERLEVAGRQPDALLTALRNAAAHRGERPLVVVDALNETPHRHYWWKELEHFIARASSVCPEVAVLLSVRTGFVDDLIPHRVRDEARIVEHKGFADLSIAEIVQFCRRHGAEASPIPLFAPEFRNPLLLRLLCSSLTEPFHDSAGIKGSAGVFRGWLERVNATIAKRLGYNPRADNLVERCLSAWAQRTWDQGQRSLPVSWVMRIIERSLEGMLTNGSAMYGALIDEGLLREDASADGHRAGIAYDRLADGLEARRALQEIVNALDGQGPERVTAVLSRCTPDVKREACVLAAEEKRRELVDLVQGDPHSQEWRYAFVESLLWRGPESFFPCTWDWIEQLLETDHQVVLDVVLRLAAVPDHPLNAHWLHRWLAEKPMPERDAIWSTWAFTAWEDGDGPLHALVGWAFDDDLGDGPQVDLLATALGWCLTSSHRFLRDRSTAALVHLLTNRWSHAIRFVERFEQIDDPYIVERVYAVAYGVATRSRPRRARSGLRRLARLTYDVVFASGRPPPHILLRDYARGVVERAALLDVAGDIDLERVRPPYQSDWPRLPTEAEADAHRVEGAVAAYSTFNPAWSQFTIAASIEHFDFARYVVEAGLRHWCAVPLDEPTWERRTVWDAIDEIVADFDGHQMDVWRTCRERFRAEMSDWSARSVGEWMLRQLRGEPDGALDAHHATLSAIYAELRARLDHPRLGAVLALLERCAEGRADLPRPGLPIDALKRHLLCRVFALGYTVERFGEFDRFIAHRSDDTGHKPERMGKKYQWIAWHELLALVADRFQFGGADWGQSITPFEGPSQIFVRDIDPTCTLAALPVQPAEPSSPAWWKADECPAVRRLPGPEQASPTAHAVWIREVDDLPSLPALVSVEASDGSRWVNLDASFHWSSGRASHHQYGDVSERVVWLGLTGYIVRASEAATFVQWAEGVDFWNGWMPEPPAVTEVFLGEAGWAPAWSAALDAERWLRPEKECPVEVMLAAARYTREGSGSDCAIDEGYTLSLPSDALIRGLELHWSGQAADFVGRDDVVVTQDPAAHHAGPGCLLARLEAVEAWLARERLAMCWMIRGEKRLSGGWSDHTLPRQRLSGACCLRVGQQISGFVKHLEDGSQTEPLPLLAMRRL